MIRRTWVSALREAAFAVRSTPVEYAKRTMPVWTLLLVILVAAANLWGPGIVNTRGGGDSPFLLQRTHQMAANLRAGVFPVRWMPDAAYGLGFPFFNHYSALPFYLAAGFDVLGLDMLTAIKLTQSLGFIFAALAMYGWIHRLWRNRAAAWLAAIAYTVAPFHLVNVYVRGDSMSEFYAFVFYPLILWALDRVAESSTQRQRPKILDVIALALAYAGLVLAHNISAFIFSPFVALYLALLALNKVRQPSGNAHTQRRTWRGIIKPLSLGCAGILLGMALSAWAWLPALLERGYVQSEGLTGDFFDYANHFRSANLIQPKLLFDYAIEVTLGGASPFAMGGPQALVVVGGLIVLLGLWFGKRPGTKDDRHSGNDPSLSVPSPASLAFPVVGLLFSTVMITPLSRWLWDHVPLLPMVQFPWRFLSVQSFFAATAAAAWVVRLKGWRAWATGAAVATLLVLTTLVSLSPERLLIGPDDVTTTRLQEYELFTGNIGTTVRYEWLPQAADPRPFTSDVLIGPEPPPQIMPLAGTLAGATQTQRQPSKRTWHVQAGDDGATLAFPLLYWPGWHAWVDGEETAVWAVEGAGYLALEVPAGEHSIQLRLDRTSLRAGAETLSLAALFTLLGLILWRGRLSRSRILSQLSRLTHHASRNTHYTLFLLSGLLFLAAQSSPPASAPGDLTMDFVALPYLHHNPDGLVFADPASGAEAEQARLLHYTYSIDRLEPGDTLEVILNWDARQSMTNDLQVSLRLVSPAEHLTEQLAQLGGASLTLAGSSASLAPTTVHQLKIPKNAPRGLYLLQLGLRGNSGELYARTPTGKGRGPIYLRPVRVAENAPVGPDAPVLALVGPDIRLHAAELEQVTFPNSPANLTAELEWSNVNQLAANYALSVRLLDPSGNQRASTDTQPGYGFAPTSLWRPGERIGDRYVLPLPGDLEPGDGYRLLFVFYRHPSITEVARVTLGPFALPLESPLVFSPKPRLFEVPTVSHALDIDFTDPVDSTSGDHIHLAGYDLAVEAGSVDLTLWWIAQRQPRINYTLFVHLFDPADETNIATQYDAMPRQGSYPTSNWLAGEVISDTARLSLSKVTPGAYQLALGLYDVTTRDRLTATTSDGVSLPDGRLVLPEIIEVPGE